MDVRDVEVFSIQETDTNYMRDCDRQSFFFKFTAGCSCAPHGRSRRPQLPRLWRALGCEDNWCT